jgi:hypothetical protein
MFLIWFSVGRAQTPSPLIRPSGSVFGGAVMEKSQNQGGGDWPNRALIRVTGNSARPLSLSNKRGSLVVSHIRIIRPEKPNELDFLSSDFRT